MISISPQAPRRSCLLVIVAIASFITVSGCDAATDSDETADSGLSEQELLAITDETACTQLGLGTTRLLDASVDSADAPDMPLPDAVYTIRLQEDGTGSFHGYFGYPAPAAGDFHIYQETNASLTLSQTNTLEGLTAINVTTCTDLQLFRTTTPLAEENLLLHFYDAAQADVRLVIKSKQ
jgi:hypothetical protein